MSLVSPPSSCLTTPPEERVEGVIEIITFHNEENGYCVLKVRVKGQKDLLTIVGTCLSPMLGGVLEAQGQWVHDKRYGHQFKASKIQVSQPATKESIEKFLSSGLLKGIGKVTAQKLIKSFGKKVFQVLDNEPEKLQTVAGLGDAQAAKILASWEEHKTIHDIMLFLHEHGISNRRAMHIYRAYGEDAISIITNNPYRLAQDFYGIGFPTADAIAMKLGIPPDSLIRAKAALAFRLHQACLDGHCGLPTDTLLSSTAELIQADLPTMEEALQGEVHEGRLVPFILDGKEYVILRHLHQEERSIAFHLKRLRTYPLPFPKTLLSSALTQNNSSLILSSSQQEALLRTLSEKVSIITGGPGVGKTTLLMSILEILKKQRLQIALCAPTGRAAKRLHEATSLETKTIHRLLGINPLSHTYTYTEDNPLKVDVVVVDEVSMVDVPLMAALLKAIPSKAMLILVGDKDQLPSVGPGQVLSDLLGAENIPVSALTETFRQAATSHIIQISQAINRGEKPIFTHDSSTCDCFFFERNTPEESLQTVLELALNRIPKKFGYTLSEGIQILSPMNRGILGCRNLNVEIQKLYNPPAKESIQRMGYYFGPNDKVMQMENNYDKEIYNGDLGKIIQINPTNNTALIRYDERELVYETQELEEISLAYATTIHKSQGSEYPVVIIPLMMEHYPMLQRKLIYTGITRGKKIVILIGQRKALSLAISNVHSRERYTFLKHHIRI